MKSENRVRRPRRSARAFLREGAFRRFHAFGVLFMLGLAAPSPGQEPGRQAPATPDRDERVLAASTGVDLPSKALNASLPSQLYAAALLAGLGEPESVRLEMRVVIAEADERFLRELYARAVLAGFEWPGLVRHRIRVAGVQGEHVTRYPDEVVNRVYAVSVLLGNAEDVEAIRSALDRMIERAGAVIAPFMDGPGEGEGPFDGCAPNEMRDEYGECRDMNQIIDDLIRRELEWAGWFADGLEQVDWEKIGKGSCRVIGDLSTLGLAKDLAELGAAIAASDKLTKQFVGIVKRWLGHNIAKRLLVRGVGPAIDVLDIMCKVAG